MMRVMVTGIGTEVGKTLVSAIITQMLEGDYWKPVESGELELDSVRMSYLLDASRHRIYPSAYSFKFPLSPHHAARLEGKFIDPALLRPPETERTLVIETAGGVFVPLNPAFTNLDLIKSLNCECIVVSKHYLGSINHTLLTLEVLKIHKIPVLGVIFNGESNPDTENAILKISQQRFLGRLRPEKQINQNIIQGYVKRMENSFLSKTSGLIEKDRECLWHPYTQMKTARNFLPIVRGKGIYLYDENGKSFVDGTSSWCVNLHGHAHPYIVSKLQEQLEVLEHVTFADFTHPWAIELASRLLSILPGSLSKIYYSDNGSTSVEIALKMALQYWSNQNPRTEKSKVICIKGSYHGDTFGAMAVAGQNVFNQPFWKYLFHVETIDFPKKGREEESIMQLKQILHQGEAACFIYEPLILGVGGMHVYSANVLETFLRLCKAYEVITIADEVMTGFGRTTSLFASEYLTETPDIICLSKGLTGGFLPLGATACTQKIYDAFLSDDKHHALLHGHSYTGNTLACCSALASLDLLLEKSSEDQRQMIARQHEIFCQKWQSHPKLNRCVSLGTILILEYKGDLKTASYFQSIRDRLYYFFLDRGILLRPLGNVIYLMPPYCILEDELQWIYSVIIQTLEEAV